MFESQQVAYGVVLTDGAKGRNGLMKQTGLTVLATSDPLAIPEEPLLQLGAITTQGISEATRLSFRVADLALVMNAILKVAQLPDAKRRSILALLTDPFDDIHVAPDQPVRIDYPDVSVKVARTADAVTLDVVTGSSRNIPVQSVNVPIDSITASRKDHTEAAVNW